MQLEEPKTPEEILMEKEAAEGVSRALLRLRPRQERVMRLRYGINTHPHTLAEIGEIIGRSKERVRQIIAKSHRRLAHQERFHRELRHCM